MKRLRRCKQNLREQKIFERWDSRSLIFLDWSIGNARKVSPCKGVPQCMDTAVFAIGHLHVFCVATAQTCIATCNLHK
jgi:hypothetical protein